MRHLFNDARILLVEDEAPPTCTTEETLRSSGYQRITRTSDSTVIGLFGVQTPDLVVLDGHGTCEEALAALQRVVARFADDSHTLVLVLSAADCIEFAARALDCGASDITARARPREVALRVRNLLRVHYALLDQEGIQRRRDEQRTSELAVLSDDVVERFRFLLKLRGIASHADLERLGDLAERLAAALGAPRSISRLYRAAAPLRDIGTLVTASDREEWDHARSGHRVLRGSELPALRLAAEIAKAHHEKWDGSGCFGLRAYDIPTPGRVVAVVGAFVDLTAEAPESAEATSRALQQITSRAGEWYDPRMVDVFRTIVEAHMEPGRAHLRVIAQAA